MDETLQRVDCFAACGLMAMTGNKMSAMPEAGKLLIAPAFWTHKHKGNPPGEGRKKYIITGWIEIDRKNHIREEFADDYFK